jgi:hypothetical protein
MLMKIIKLKINNIKNDDKKFIAPTIILATLAVGFKINFWML